MKRSEKKIELYCNQKEKLLGIDRKFVEVINFFKQMLTIKKRKT